MTFLLIKIPAKIKKIIGKAHRNKVFFETSGSYKTQSPYLSLKNA